jgi:hypothetical protein
MIIKSAMLVKETNFRERRLNSPVKRKTPASATPNVVVNQPEPVELAACEAVVETVSVVEPLPVIEVGLKLQVLSRGNPAHDAAEKLTVPAYPACPEMLSTMVPEAPGLETPMDGDGDAKSKSGCTFTVISEDVEPV